jgi:hypothetical protein
MNPITFKGRVIQGNAISFEIEITTTEPVTILKEVTGKINVITAHSKQVFEVDYDNGEELLSQLITKKK